MPTLIDKLHPDRFSGMSGRMAAVVGYILGQEWSAPRIVFRTPEMSWDKSYFCYAAKAHPELSRQEDELLVSYVCNADNFWKMAADARIYRPQFLRLKFSPLVF